jgi:hypothetical protein
MNTDKERLLKLANLEDGCPISVGGLMLPNKILFLDIDGVLNSAAVLERQRRGDAIDRDMVERVNRIIDATGCKVVISSTWRLLHPLGELKALLRLHGMRDVVIDKTPDLDRTHNNRGDEIQAWLKQNPSVEKFVILDDDSDMSDVIGHLVQTSFKTGLQDQHVDRAIANLS